MTSAVKRPHGRRTADRLLDAALQVHAEHGLDGLTVAAVLGRSGVSLGSLYHHFGSISGLQAALYARCLRRLLDAVLAAVLDEDASADGARAAVHATVLGYLRFTAAEPDVARFVHAASYASFQPQAAPYLGGEVEPVLESLREVFRPHLAAGRLAPVSEPLLEVLLVGPPAEVARRWLAGDRRVDLDDGARELPERVWQAVRGSRA